LKSALGGDDKDVIETKARALAEASSSLASQAYAPNEADADAQGAAGGAGSTRSGGKDDVLDAEFEEVKDKKKGS
jgi:molecular chaperone DnaK